MWELLDKESVETVSLTMCQNPMRLLEKSSRTGQTIRDHAQQTHSLTQETTDSPGPTGNNFHVRAERGIYQHSSV